MRRRACLLWRRTFSNGASVCRLRSRAAQEVADGLAPSALVECAVGCAVRPACGLRSCRRSGVECSGSRGKDQAPTGLCHCATALHSAGAAVRPPIRAWRIPDSPRDSRAWTTAASSRSRRAGPLAGSPLVVRSRSRRRRPRTTQQSTIVRRLSHLPRLQRVAQ